MLEIGSTYYRPHMRGTGFNRRVKAMMPRRAFACGFRLVVPCRYSQPPQPSGDEEIGAVREGLLRADRITLTGHVRDTVLFAILKDEWPI